MQPAPHVDLHLQIIDKWRLTKSWVHPRFVTSHRARKGVMFISIEDETGVANLAIWPSLYEKQWRVMLAVQGRVQREGL